MDTKVDYSYPQVSRLSQGHSGARESKARSNTDAFGFNEIDRRLRLHWQGGPVAGLDARSLVPKRERVAMKIAAPRAETAADAAASALPTRFDPFKLPSVIPPWWCSTTIWLAPVPAPALPLSDVS